MTVPPIFLPMFGWLMIQNLGHRNRHKGPIHAYRPYRGPSRVSLTATSARVSSPGGMDGERIHPRGGRRAFKR